MSQDDSISISRSQRVDLCAADGRTRIILDHPLNAPLVGIPSQATIVRASKLTVQSCDKSIVVYAARAGTALRIATAAIAHREDGSVCLTDWWIEPGFEHTTGTTGDATVHRVVQADRAIPADSRSE